MMKFGMRWRIRLYLSNFVSFHQPWCSFSISDDVDAFITDQNDYNGHAIVHQPYWYAICNVMEFYAQKNIIGFERIMPFAWFQIWIRIPAHHHHIIIIIKPVAHFNLLAKRVCHIIISVVVVVFVVVVDGNSHACVCLFVNSVLARLLFSQIK